MTPEREDREAEMESYRRELCWAWQKTNEQTNETQTHKTQGKAPADGETTSQSTASFSAQRIVFPAALTVTSARLTGS